MRVFKHKKFKAYINALKEKNINLERFARDNFGYSYNTFYRYTKGDRHPSLRFICDLVAITGESFDAWLTLPKKRNPQISKYLMKGTISNKEVYDNYYTLKDIIDIYEIPHHVAYYNIVMVNKVPYIKSSSRVILIPKMFKEVLDGVFGKPKQKNN